MLYIRIFVGLYIWKRVCVRDCKTRAKQIRGFQGNQKKKRYSQITNREEEESFFEYQNGKLISGMRWKRIQGWCAILRAVSFLWKPSKMSNCYSSWNRSLKVCDSSFSSISACFFSPSNLSNYSRIKAPLCVFAQYQRFKRRWMRKKPTSI